MLTSRRNAFEKWVECENPKDKAIAVIGISE